MPLFINAQNNVNIPLEEDASIVQSLLEEEYENQTYLEDFIVRMRIEPLRKNEKWHNKIQYSNDKYSIMLRSDYKTDNFNSAITGFSIKGEWSKISIIVGTFKTEIGQGLLFSSEYGRIKNSGNIFSPVKSNLKVKQNISSTALDGSTGIVVNHNLLQFSHSILIDKNNRSNTYFARVGDRLNHIGISLNFTEIKPTAISSFWHIKKQGYFWSGELAARKKISAYITTVGFKSQHNKWIINYRYFPTNWQTVIGRPYSAFYRDQNETGILLLLQQKIKQFTISTWLDTYSELAYFNNEPLKNGYDFYISFQYKIDAFTRVSFSYREKKKDDLVDVDYENITHQIWSDKLIRIGKIQFIIPVIGSLHITYSSLNIDPEPTETGYLISKRFDIFTHDKFEYSCNLNYYKTDTWDSRLYSYSPGLPGEFNIKSYYGKGLEFTHLILIIVGNNTDIGFKMIHNITELDSQSNVNLTFQLDYKI